jgi:hexosaminidase
MMKKILTLAFCLISFVLKAQDPSSMNIIPAPASVKITGENFHFNPSTSLFFNQKDKELQQLANYFGDYIFGISGLKPKWQKKQDNSIHLLLVSKAELGEEGYEMDVSPKHIKIMANTRKGIFYGMQSLFQMLTPIRTNESLSVLGMHIIDYPQFQWRGMMLDVSRHFFSPETIKQFIDLMALYKLNTFHWHLVDDSGWRIEIKRYPLLTQVGAWRVDRSDKSWSQREAARPGEKTTYGGYYTQEQIREIVAYAQMRNIIIVPEIELPGHSVAALAAYPQYSCTQRPQFVNTGGQYPKDVQSSYCPGNEEAFVFLENILLEVMELFPSRFIHIGGDEVDKSPWKQCPKCQQRMREESLENEDELQSYMIRRMERFLSSHKRRLIGWDEILEGGLAPGATVMSWRGESGGVAAARMGHEVVMSPGYPCYFDHYQAGPEGEPLAIGGMNTLKNVYDYQPVPRELDAEAAKHVLGAQANVWTEFIPTVEQLEYMILPRMLALSEVVWSPVETRSWEDFNRRLQSWHFRMFEKKGLRYSRGNTKVSMKPLAENGRLSVSLHSELIGAEIRYTLDGTIPTINST